MQEQGISSMYDPGMSAAAGDISGVQQHQLKAEIATHPLWEQLLSAHVACLRVATPIDHLPLVDAQVAQSHHLQRSYAQTVNNSLAPHERQDLDNFLVSHFEAAKRVLRYIKGTIGMGILLSANSKLELEAACDADWGTCPMTRRSLTGYCVKLGESLVSWKTKKQKTVARSSAEAEFRSMASTTCELTWLQRLLQDLGVKEIKPAVLKCDSKAAIYIASNPVFHERTKHIDIDCYTVREKVLDGTIKTVFVKSNDQEADVLTKSLWKSQFHYLLDKLGLVNAYGGDKLEEECEESKK